jgi:hypothetical protein
MSNEINTGGPAFPLNWEQKGEFWAFGMTLRDYFAAKAMQGLMLAEIGTHVPSEAYRIADAMMKAREPKSEGN